MPRAALFTDVPSVHERLLDVRQALTEAGLSSADAALDAEVLARHVLGWDRAALVARWRDPAPPDFQERLLPLIARRLNREPVAYITGQREFWGLDFAVTPDVLIPRPETELVVEQALHYAGDHGTPETVVDVGTGSGAIAVSLATEWPTARVTATDLSAAALAVAARNARRHGVEARLRFVQADLLDHRVPLADLIVSNPPYVRDVDRQALQPEVGKHEPALALFGGPGDGLALVRRLLDTAPAYLSPGGALIMEFGDGQEAGVLAAAQQSGWEAVRVCRDLQDIPRVAVLRR